MNGWVNLAKLQFTTRNGEKMDGVIVHQYYAFEGGMRYIFRTDNGEYRCVRDEDGNFVEFVA